MTASVLRRAALAVALTLAGACVAPPPSKVEKLGADEGVVLLSVSGNSGQVGQVSTISLADRRRGRNFTLGNVAKGLARDTALFAGVVQEGEYEFTDVFMGDKRYGFPESAQQVLGKVQVTRGTLSDLGRMVLIPINFGLYPGRASREYSNVELLRRVSPEDAARLPAKTAPGWTSPRAEKDRYEEYALAHPVGAQSAVELPGGEIALASRFGTVLIRTKQGRWTGARTGALEALLAVAPAPGGKVDGNDTPLVAVGELDTIARMEPSGKLVLLDPGNLPTGSLVAIVGTPRGWYVGHRTPDKLTVLRSDRLDAGAWEVVRSFPATYKVGLATVELRFWMWGTRAGLGLALSDGRVSVLDVTTGTWGEHRIPGTDVDVEDLAVGPGGALGALVTTSASSTFAVSRDDGKSWTTLVGPRSVATMKLATNQRVLAPRVLADGTIVVVSPGGSAELHASKDGKTWETRSRELPANDIMPLPTRGLIAASDALGIGRIAHSWDGGATWEVEYSSFDLKAFDAQEGKR